MLEFFLVCTFALAQIGLSSSAELTRDQFNAAVTVCGYPSPSDPEIYPNMADATKDFSQEELAMFLAQLNHESGGFQFREEIACKDTGCPGQYKDSVGLEGKSYYGRGFIQLTWGANYKAASEALGMGDKLLQQPELVAQDTSIAVKVSVWYWTDRVRPQMAGQKSQFGASTKAINGAIECSGGWNEQASNRYQCYLKVADALGVQNKAQENGCYN